MTRRPGRRTGSATRATAVAGGLALAAGLLAGVAGVAIGQSAVNAVIGVTSASPTPSVPETLTPSASGTPTPSVSGTATVIPSSPPPAPGRVRVPKGCAAIAPVGSGVPTCGYLTGYADVAKLYGAALLQPRPPARPALLNLDFAERHVLKRRKHELIVYSTAELYYRGLHELPPVRATFLAFRLFPVAVTLFLKELTPIRIVSVSGTSAPPFPITVRASMKMTIGISDVLVNGVPLEIGARCRPANSVTLTLIGRGDNTIPPKGYTVAAGGPLTGRLTIPPFVDCGVSENLDRLLTGSISGPGNFVKMTQGKLCGPSQPANWVCPPRVPRARH
jgi:hypothetical protein